MNKRHLNMAATLIGLPMLLFCVLTACTRKQASYTGPPTPIRIGIQDNTACSLIWIAKAEGYFEKNGLDAELVRYPSGKLALQGLLNGEADYVTCADMPLALQGFETNEVRIIATIAQNNNGAWIIARRDAGIQTPADLRNKRIGTQKNSAVHYFLSQFLIYHQISTAEVQIVFLPATALPEALDQGEIDAFSMRNPFVGHA
ncbi:MAG: hypothetical protein EOM20_17740, partial [Spartobacteria bacterium]|nr:hypothetical protein [Spartobacteria bacterium]